MKQHQAKRDPARRAQADRDDDRRAAPPPPVGELLALQHTHGNGAVAGLVQRVKGDKHTGKYVKRPSDGAFMIRVDAGLRSLWFRPPEGHNLTDGQAVSFVEGENGAVTELSAGAVPKAYVLFDGRTTISDTDIAKGTLQPIAGRTNGDIELVIASGVSPVVIHVHPYVGSGGTPGGGAVAIGRAWSTGNASSEIVTKIAERPDYKDVVAAAAPKRRADGNWKK